MSASNPRPLFGGVNAAVLTAMHDDLSPDLDRMAAHCRWLLGNGCNGLAVLGTTGEANSLGIGERLDLLDGLTARGIAADRMLPGVGTPALTDTVLLARHCEQLGCRGVLVLPPFFYKNPTEDGLFAYFSELINRLGSGLPIYLYHFPAQSAVPFTLSLVGRLLRAFPTTVRGIKDSSGDFANTRGYVDAYAKDGFEVYCGDDGALSDLLAIGGAGCITAAANVGCPLSARVYAGRTTPDAREAQTALSAVRAAVTSAPLIPALKALVARRENDPAWTNVRPPFLKLDPAAAARVQAAFDASGMAQAA